MGREAEISEGDMRATAGMADRDKMMAVVRDGNVQQLSRRMCELVDELHGRLGDLEGRLQMVLLPDDAMPRDRDERAQADRPPSSELAGFMRETITQFERGLVRLSQITGRIDV